MGFEGALERIQHLTELLLEDPAENPYTILTHLGEETGEFCTAMCVEDGSRYKSYKKLDETSYQEAIDMAICVFSLYYARGGKTEDIVAYMNKKLDKWEKLENGLRL
jgi:hypothetical protein